MDEPAVFDHVIDTIDERGYEPLVHVPSAHEDRFQHVVEKCPSHQIAIRGRYPDIVGFTQTNRIFAVEVKGDTDMQKGIGQALTYQQGSHYSYLAADHEAVEEIADIATSNGLGLIRCTTSGAIEWETPNQVLSRDLLPDIEGQLSYRLHRRESAGKIASMDLAQPLNFLAPVLAIQRLDTPTKDAIADVIKDEYGFSATTGAINGARVLAIVDEEHDAFHLTEQGTLAATVLAGSGIDSLSALKDVKDAIPRGHTVYDHYPTLATLLRTLFLRHPEMRLLVEALGELRAECVTVPEVIELLVRTYPNVFLNLFCTRSGREDARAYIERGAFEAIYGNEETWKDLIRSNVIFNFVHQLRHAGILAAETSGHGRALEEFDPDAKPWYINRVDL